MVDDAFAKMREKERLRNMREFYAGVDLGEVQDHSALCILEAASSGYIMRRLDRLPLGVPYTHQAAVIKAVVNKPLYAQNHFDLALDVTGVGRGVSDILFEEGVAHKKITITGGRTARHELESLEWHVPKRELVRTLVLWAEQGKLKIPSSLRFAREFEEELSAFEARINQRGHTKYEAEAGFHDDLVLAVSLGCWVAEERHRGQKVFFGFCDSFGGRH